MYIYVYTHAHTGMGRQGGVYMHVNLWSQPPSHGSGAKKTAHAQESVVRNSDGSDITPTELIQLRRN
jgi:hypothetical protein